MTIGGVHQHGHDDCKENLLEDRSNLLCFVLALICNGVVSINKSSLESLHHVVYCCVVIWVLHLDQKLIISQIIHGLCTRPKGHHWYTHKIVAISFVHIVWTR